jgi:hypothetical protein
LSKPATDYVEAGICADVGILRPVTQDGVADFFQAGAGAAKIDEGRRARLRGIMVINDVDSLAVFGENVMVPPPAD